MAKMKQQKHNSIEPRYYPHHQKKYLKITMSSLKPNHTAQLFHQILCDQICDSEIVDTQLRLAAETGN